MGGKKFVTVLSRTCRTIGRSASGGLYRWRKSSFCVFSRMLAGAETFVDIARFGDTKLDLLRRFRPFRDGTPAHDHLGDIFATLDAQAFQDAVSSSLGLRRSKRCRPGGSVMIQPRKSSR